MRSEKASLSAARALVGPGPTAALEPLPLPSCWACGAMVHGPGGTLAFSGWPLRRNGTWRKPEAGRLLIVAWLCTSCLGAPWVARSPAYLIPLVLLYSEAEYEQTVLRLAAQQPWGADPKVAPALAQGHQISCMEERDEGPAIEAALASTKREEGRTVAP